MDRPVIFLSAVMHTILEGRPEPITRERNSGRLAEVNCLHTRNHSAQPSPSCVLRREVLSLSESLHLSEKAANDFVQEVAEWSMLNVKELVEP